MGAVSDSTDKPSHRAIARSLNARGVTTARGGVWTAVQVSSIFEARITSDLVSAAAVLALLAAPARQKMRPKDQQPAAHRLTA
jgi:hypothetical protein